MNDDNLQVDGGLTQTKTKHLIILENEDHLDTHYILLCDLIGVLRRKLLKY
jgi:hypothetical protein